MPEGPQEQREYAQREGEGNVQHFQNPQPGSFEDDDSSPSEEEEEWPDFGNGTRTGDEALIELPASKQRYYHGLEENLLEWIEKASGLYDDDVPADEKEEILKSLQLAVRLMQNHIEKIDLSHKEQVAMELWGQLTQETRNLGQEIAQGYKSVREAQEVERQRAFRGRLEPPPAPRRKKWTRTRQDTALPTPAPVPVRPPPPTRQPDESQFGPPPSSPITPPAEGQRRDASLLNLKQWKWMRTRSQQFSLNILVQAMKSQRSKRVPGSRCITKPKTCSPRQCASRVRADRAW